jgi:hypothetical protein
LQIKKSGGGVDLPGLTRLILDLVTESRSGPSGDPQDLVLLHPVDEHAVGFLSELGAKQAGEKDVEQEKTTGDQQHQVGQQALIATVFRSLLTGIITPGEKQ